MLLQISLTAQVECDRLAERKITDREEQATTDHAKSEERKPLPSEQ